MSKREFVTGTPMPLGHRRHTVNSEQVDASLERIAAKVAEMIAPTIAEAVAKELQAQGVATNAGSNGRKLNPSDITSRYSLPDGEFDTLPDGDSPGGASTPTDQYQLPD